MSWNPFGRRSTSPRRKLHSDDVRRLVRQFLDEWHPFRDRYGEAGDISVDWIKSPRGDGTWAASITPAIDVRCGVVVDDELGQVIEARIVAMRQGGVLAEWSVTTSSS